MSDKNRIIYLSILIVCMVGIIILLCPKPEYKATFNLKQDFSIMENYVDIAFVENPNKIIDMASTSQNDSFTEEDIENSKKGIIATIKTIDDEQDTEITYYFGQEIAQTKISLEEYKEKIEKIQKKDIVNIANKVSINTIYFLRD